jgi:hypothetical protein
MFADYAGCEALELAGQEKALRENKLYISAVKDSSGAKILKLANGSEEDQSLTLTSAEGVVLTGNAEIARLAAASGKAKVIVATDAIGTSGGTKGVSPDFMTNLQVCEKRGPEAASFTVSKESLNGEIILPAKSFVVVKLS